MAERRKQPSRSQQTAAAPSCQCQSAEVSANEPAFAGAEFPQAPSAKAVDGFHPTAEESPHALRPSPSSVSGV